MSQPAIRYLANFTERVVYSNPSVVASEFLGILTEEYKLLTDSLPLPRKHQRAFQDFFEDAFASKVKSRQLETFNVSRPEQVDHFVRGMGTFTGGEELWFFYCEEKELGLAWSYVRGEKTADFVIWSGLPVFVDAQITFKKDKMPYEAEIDVLNYFSEL